MRNPKNPSTRPTTSGLAEPPLLQLSCDTCGRRIGPGEHGAIHVDLRDATAADAGLRASEERSRRADVDQHWVADLMLVPNLATWLVQCSSCAHNCVGCYCIDTRDCQTPLALLQWTAHLNDKRWLRATNWFGFIGELARNNGVHARADRRAA